MTKKSIIWGVVILIILLVTLNSCFEIKKKPTTKDLVIQVKDVAVQILESVGILQNKVDTLAADVDTIKVDIRELKNRKGPTVVYRTKTVVVQQSSPDPVYYSQPQPQTQSTDQPQQRVEPQRVEQVGTIVPGDLPGPQDLLFCIDLEPAKSTDSSKKFLFWELVNGLGYQISNVVPNFTGKSANMRLAPGGSVDGISYDGNMLRMSVASVGNWYAQIMGVPMPSDWRPALRSNKSGWSNSLMTRSGDSFVYRF